MAEAQENQRLAIVDEDKVRDEQRLLKTFGARTLQLGVYSSIS